MTGPCRHSVSSSAQAGDPVNIAEARGTFVTTVRERCEHGLPASRAGMTAEAAAAERGRNMADAAAVQPAAPSSPNSKRGTCIRSGTATSASRRSSRSRRTRRSSGAGATSSRSCTARSREVSIDDIERRALIMSHPAFGEETTTTSTLLAAFTVLDPGDHARPHRHTGAAIRFATRAEGAVDHRQRPPLRHEGGRPDPDPADGLARPHQPERPPHHLVRRRQHAADPRA